MPHLSKIGQKSLSNRVILTVIYALLIAGGATMVVPFLIWISISFKSEVDGRSFDVIPAYWHDRSMLQRKFLEQQANYDPTFYGRIARDSALTFADITLPAPARGREYADYMAFVDSLPPTYTVLASAGYPHDVLRLKYGLVPSLEAYRRYCLQRYQSLERINKAYNINETTITRLIPLREEWWMRSFQPQFDRRMVEFLAFKNNRPLIYQLPSPAESCWSMYLKTRIDTNPEKVNAVLGTRYANLDNPPFPSRVPAGNSRLAIAWEDCVRQDMSLFYLRVDDSARPAWIAFLNSRYKGKVALYNEAHGTARSTFDAVPLPDTCPKDIAGMGEWNDFLSTAAPVDSLYLDTPEGRYRAFLRKRYRTLDAVNAAYGTHYRAWDAVLPPVSRVMAAYCAANEWKVRWDFITRNYRTVFEYMLLQGRAFANTIIYVVLSLLVTLTINPMAAYALSRFKLPATNKILLFLLATMAFPAEIAMIPNFLLLKQMQLLNTFWALVLPGMASGFSIFLLKGMFDALPQDLYESAELDGAGEVTIFWCITMPLVKPFLAYLALGTFTAAYAAFAFAFILCPDAKMWTLMVYLQQMEQWASQPVQFAAFVLASIPTLIVFIACQRIIMRGIALPTEK